MADTTGPVPATGITDEMVRLAAAAIMREWHDEVAIRDVALGALEAALAGRTVVAQPAASSEEWVVFYGGPDPDNAAGVEQCDDEADAREHVQWVVHDQGRGVACRHVFYGSWILAAESSGDGEPS